MDIVYVTYNSEKWIEGCLLSLLQSDTDLTQLHVWVVDNCSTDNTVEYMKEKAPLLSEKLGSFEIIVSNENLGFGCGNNLGAQKGCDDIICFLNVDTELFPDTLEMLRKEIEKSEPETAQWELRQLPYEHPKIYNPVNGTTTWCSGAAFAVRREVFEMLGGFDPHIFMYAEDVDLSWRIRKQGYELKYVPKSTIMHYTYQSVDEVKPNQYIFSIINNLWLRYKYGSIKDILWGNILFAGLLILRNPFPGCRKKLWNEYVKMNSNLKWAWNERRDRKPFSPSFLRFDYELTRDGEYYEGSRMISEVRPLVSVLVRTCGRPETLRETLKSLENQTYPNVEVVIVEDGEETAKEMILQEFPSMNIHYLATGEKVGRSKAGNLAMQAAKGEFLNFLDDDDLFFADHIETLVNAAVTSGKKAAYATAYETPIKVYSQTPYVYEVTEYKKVYTQAFDSVKLCHHNYIPIQCILFHKSLFELYGGMDETLDALEDWDLWVRYSLYTDFEFVKKTTSIYRVPNNKEDREIRQSKLDDALKQVREKHKSYIKGLNVYDIAMLYERKY